MGLTGGPAERDREGHDAGVLQRVERDAEGRRIGERLDPQLDEIGGVVGIAGVGRIRVGPVGLGEQVAGRPRVVGVDGDGRFVLRAKPPVLVHRDVRAYVRSAQARGVKEPRHVRLGEVRHDCDDAGEGGDLTNLPTTRPIEEAESRIGPRGWGVVAARRNSQRAAEKRRRCRPRAWYGRWLRYPARRRCAAAGCT